MTLFRCKSPSAPFPDALTLNKTKKLTLVFVVWARQPQRQRAGTPRTSAAHLVVLLEGHYSHVGPFRCGSISPPINFLPIQDAREKRRAQARDIRVAWLVGINALVPSHKASTITSRPFRPRRRCRRASAATLADRRWSIQAPLCPEGRWGSSRRCLVPTFFFFFRYSAVTGSFFVLKKEFWGAEALTTCSALS